MICDGIGLSLMQLLCIVLYCDTNEFQSNFSSTFRKKYQFESIEELKKRHQKYFHFAKGITQVVHLYGVDGDEGMSFDKKKDEEYEKGSFYCGLNCELNIGEFAIYLKSPTSTSKNIEVAINFATKTGNDTAAGKYQKMFDCSWISRFSEENERLWIGYNGMRRLRIESIIIIESNKKYQLFFHSLWIFDHDMILSGESVDFNIPKENILILSILISNQVDGSIKNKNIDEYILNCFDLHLLNKRNI